MVDKLTTVHKSRLGKRIGRLNDAEMAQLDQAILISSAWSDLHVGTVLHENWTPSPSRYGADSWPAGSFHAWYDPRVRSDGANSARCISARAQRRSFRFAATSA